MGGFSARSTNGKCRDWTAKRERLSNVRQNTAAWDSAWERPTGTGRLYVPFLRMVRKERLYPFSIGPCVSISCRLGDLNYAECRLSSSSARCHPNEGDVSSGELSEYLMVVAGNMAMIMAVLIATAEIATGRVSGWWLFF